MTDSGEREPLPGAGRPQHEHGATEPESFRAVELAELQEHELRVEGIEVVEQREGIWFSSANELKRALTLFGSGATLKRWATEIDDDEDDYEEPGPLFENPRVAGFVDAMLTTELAEAQLGTKPRAVRQSYQGDAPGLLRNSRVEVMVDEDGMELRLYGHDAPTAEADLAAVLDTQQTLRAVAVEFGANQTADGEHFLVNARTVCDALGVDYDFDAESWRDLRMTVGGAVQIGGQADGVRVTCEPLPFDESTQTPLTDYMQYGHDRIWGPMPNTESGRRMRRAPMLRVILPPAGDPHDSATLQHARAQAQVYANRLQAFATK